LHKLEAYKKKAKLRNDNFRQAPQADGQENQSQTAQEPLQDFLSPSLARGKQQLREAKETFLRELERRDPDWTDRLNHRRKQDIERLEFD